MPVSAMFLRQQLEQVQNIVIEQDFPERLMASGQLVPISTELNPGAETYSYKIMTAVGEAAILANGSDDIPIVSAFVEKRVGEIRTIVDGYEYTEEDVEAAQFAQMPLDSTLATIAREVMEAKLDQLGFDGDSQFNLLGFLNQPNVPTGTVAADGAQNGATNSTLWVNKTPEQVYRDLRAFAASPRAATNGVESYDIIGLPQAQFDLILGTPYPTINAGNSTIYSFFMAAQKATPSGIQAIVPIPYLAGKGAGATDLMVGWRKRDNKIKLHIPLDFTQKPVQMHNFSYRIPCRMRTGGVQLVKPLSVGYRAGI